MNTVDEMFARRRRRQREIGAVVRLAALLVLCLAVPMIRPAAADILPPGYKGVRHEIVFQGMDRFPEWDFVLYPTSLGNSRNWQTIKAGEPQHFYHLLSPHVFALRRDAGQPADKPVFHDAATPRSEIEIDLQSNVPDADPTRLIRTVYRITGVTGNRIAIEKGPDQKFDDASRTLPPEVISAAVSSRRNWIIGSAAGIFVCLAAIGLQRRHRNRAKLRPTAIVP